MHKTAVLILPDQVECKSGTGYSLSGEIGFRWDGPEPLKINVWQNPKSRKASDATNHLLGDLVVFDELGRKLEQLIFMSIPPIPDGERIINRGEYRRFGFFIWNGSVVFPRPWNYYAVATFAEAWAGKTNVVFTTSKRWFKVVEAPPKKSSL